MQRTILVATAFAPALLACAHAPPTFAGPSPSAPDPPGVAVSYRMLRAVEGGNGLLLAGRTVIDPHHGSRVNSQAAHGNGEETLELVARPVADGTVLVQVRYEESTPDGARLDWRPAMRLAHGSTTRAEASGSGWGRTLEISID